MMAPVNVDGWYGMVTIERSFIGDLPVVIMGRIREKNHCECMCDDQYIDRIMTIVDDSSRGK